LLIKHQVSGFSYQGRGCLIRACLGTPDPSDTQRFSPIAVARSNPNGEEQGKKPKADA
jgi:hypothetical protein